jgi:hypothetical protein
MSAHLEKNDFNRPFIMRRKQAIHPRLVSMSALRQERSSLTLFFVNGHHRYMRGVPSGHATRLTVLVIDLIHYSLLHEHCPKASQD